MSDSLVLSLFPGGGLLDFAFEAEGFTVVRGPDVIWGGDIRTFHPPPGRFEGIIGGDPCQSHSALANLVRAKGLEPSFPDMTPEYLRVVEEARPAWFLRENVPQAPDIKPAGYDVRSFKLDNSMLDSGDGTGHEQMRTRRFWFGTRDVPCPELRQWIDFALFQLPDAERTGPCVAGHDHAPGQRDAIKRRVTAVGGHDGIADALGDKAYRAHRERRLTQAVSSGSRAVPVALGPNGKRKSTAPTEDYKPPHRDLAEMLRLQGLPGDWLDHQPWTMQAKRKIVGNGVAVPTGRALARAIHTWEEER